MRWGACVEAISEQSLLAREDLAVLQSMAVGGDLPALA